MRGTSLSTESRPPPPSRRAMKKSIKSTFRRTMSALLSPLNEWTFLVLASRCFRKGSKWWWSPRRGCVSAREARSAIFREEYSAPFRRDRAARAVSHGVIIPVHCSKLFVRSFAGPFGCFHWIKTPVVVHFEIGLRGGGHFPPGACFCVLLFLN